MALKEEEVIVTSGKKKASVRRETSAVSATKPKIMRKNQTILPPHLLSQPHHEVEACRGREASEAKVTMGPFFDNRADIIWEVPVRDRHVNVGIRPSANSIKHETVCKAGDKCLFPHYKVDEQTNKKPNTSYFPKRRESDDKNAVAIVKSVPQLGCVSQDSDALVSQGGKSEGKPDAKSLDTNTIHSVNATSSEYLGKERTIAWKNTSQKSSSAKSPRYENWGLVPGRDWKTTAMCPKQGMEPCHKLKQAHRKGQDNILLAGCVNKRAGGKRVCSWFRSESASTLRSWRPWGHQRVRWR